MTWNGEELSIEVNNTNYEGSIVSKNNVQGLRHSEAEEKIICNVQKKPQAQTAPGVVN